MLNKHVLDMELNLNTYFKLKKFNVKFINDCK